MMGAKCLGVYHDWHVTDAASSHTTLAWREHTILSRSDKIVCSLISSVCRRIAEIADQETEVVHRWRCARKGDRTLSCRDRNGETCSSTARGENGRRQQREGDGQATIRKSRPSRRPWARSCSRMNSRAPRVPTAPRMKHSVAGGSDLGARTGRPAICWPILCGATSQ